ncbi:hypothetical protein LP415_24175 [Polaromonas sp. P1(28)-8]|nr:hypothetical protein LP415_24175 [Polaromonas sp. P1(28)-8]
MAIGADRGILVALPLASCASQLEVAGRHVQALKDSKALWRLTSPEAPIFGMTDCGLEADLFSAVPGPTNAL